MAELGGGMCLTPEPLNHLAIIRVFVFQHLDGDIAFEGDIQAAIDDGHSSLADAFINAIAPGYQ